MSFNRIAVYGHRGWASSIIVNSLAQSGAPLKLLYRPGSDVSNIPSHVKCVEVKVEDRTALINALQDVDILISLVGHEGVPRQHHLIKAIPFTSVKLFVPSDMAFRCDDLGLQISINKAKREVENSAKASGIPTTIVLPGCLAESSFSTTMMGVDIPRNRIVYMGESANQPLMVCTIKYVAAAYVSLFASQTTASELQNKVIGLVELRVTGSEMASALEQKHGTTPQILRQGIDLIDEQIRTCLTLHSPLALAWYCRKVWAAGQHSAMIGADIFDVPGYTKATLKSLIVERQMGAYRNISPVVAALFDQMQDSATS